MLLHQSARGIAIELHTGSLECSLAIQRWCLRTIPHEQVRHGGVAIDQRLFSERAVRVGVHAVGFGAMQQ